LAKIKSTRELIRKKKWCGTVTIVELENNKGVDNITVLGVTKLVNEFGKLIVLEDDIVTSPGFLTYMNEALDIYENEEKVMTVSGYCFPLKATQPDPYLIFGMTSSWGWATWKRAWDKFDPDYKSTFSKINSSGTGKKFNFDNAYDYLGILEYCNENDRPWDIRWYASVFLSGVYSLWPHQSLVQNIGHDTSGVHSFSTQKFQHATLSKDVPVKKILLEENSNARNEITAFLKTLNKVGILSKIRNKFLL